MMKKIIVVMTIFSFILTAQTVKNTDTWKDLRFLEGKWLADKPGVSKIIQKYTFILKDKFLLMRTHGTFVPSDKKPGGEVHEDMEILSYDKNRKLFVLRGFYTEGFVNRYVLKKEKNILTFLSEDIENGAPGMRAKHVFKIISDREFEQSFFVAWPDKDYNCFFTHKFKKQ